MLEKKLMASEAAREGLEQMHIDIQQELHDMKENMQKGASTRASVPFSVEQEITRYRNTLDVYRNMESRLAKYSAIVSHLSKFGSQEILSNEETKPEYLYWGLNDSDLSERLQREAPYLQDYVTYLTDKVMVTEKNLKSTRIALAKLEESYEREKSERERLEEDLNRYDDVITTLEVLREGTNAHIAELEKGNERNTGASVALRKIRESLVTFPGGLTALFNAIGFDMDDVGTRAISALSLGTTAGENKDKYIYSNAFERTM